MVRPFSFYFEDRYRRPSFFKQGAFNGNDFGLATLREGLRQIRVCLIPIGEIHCPRP